MTLILPQLVKMSQFKRERMKSVEDLANYLSELDKDIQRLMVALRPDQVTDLTDASTVETDAALAIHFRLTLTDAVGTNRTLGTPTNPRDGQRVIWEFIQPASGNKTITLDSGFSVGADIPSVTLSTTGGAIDFMGAVYDSLNTTWRVIAFVTGY